jgi:membrane-bound lytic murein transglycosylase B
MVARMTKALPLRTVLLAAAASLAALGIGPAVHAQQASFASDLDTVASRARADGISQTTIDRVLGGLTVSNRVIEGKVVGAQVSLSFAVA